MLEPEPDARMWPNPAADAVDSPIPCLSPAISAARSSAHVLPVPPARHGGSASRASSISCTTRAARRWAALTAQVC